MGFFKKTGNKAVKEGLRIVAADQLKQGLDANLGIIKGAMRYNLRKHIPESDHFSMDTARYIEIQKSFKKIVFLFIFLFFFAILYSIINVFQHDWKLVFLSLSFSVLCLAFGFRYHFWLYQMKRKMLGCTFQEWVRDEVKVRFNQGAKKAK
ncbi:MAG: hypothetical protein NTV32_04125 [Gammaproteobacteria bacterium]|nr:hypothetical protein [Gammaproteobacteria bacterium]